MFTLNKTYSTKAAAKLGAKRANAKTPHFDINEITYQQNDEGRWIAFDRYDQQQIKRTAMDPHTHCPGCSIHLENGLNQHDYSQAIHGLDDEGEADYRNNEKEYSCMACGHEFGPDIKNSPNETQATGTGLKIEKNRDEANGVSRPSVGGKCRAVWDTCDALLAKGEMPKPKMLKELMALSHPEVGPVTVTVQLYRWREFKGFSGNVTLKEGK